ncbi:efflux RND transporter periplasmic adaptor subunit [Limoniibacter endophyticus]|uniref:MexE family multidrug efflux RND transporter periplasmic adaptor subunit n=1 Tax=Limoniibacter endophyticus TaxID=1565040 RepID=A0A8J3DUB2_9HYPH|nr:efflux RND transporter periplasmic adaptor subunit [Limoniibacter endophyticus]GHC77596.1 MexE family multidrug efflux RND transporter periplasmic adaptor subunit [Limoniibacter endophyticus]
MRPKSKLSLTALSLSALFLLAACGEGDEQAGGQQMPPSAVGVIELKAENIPIISDLPGRIAPTRIAEVRPRVTGMLVERVFEQGSMVEAGDVLYRIDAEPFRVQVESAKATLQRAQSVQLQAKQTLDRQQNLGSRNVVSTQQVENAVAALAQADADVAIARANLASAELELNYAAVKAPISGRIGRAMITEGALVSSSNAESLATIQQLDPVYADFTQTAGDLIKLRRGLESGALSSSDAEAATVTLFYDDGSEYEHKGKLLFQEATVDETTGQVTLRGEFPNPEGDLLPGMYVRVKVEQGVQRNALAVPQQAVQRDNSGQASVMVVGADNKAEIRRVRTDRAVGERWVVSEGLSPGDRVIVDGFQKIGPGAPVNPTPWQGDTAEPGAQQNQAQSSQQSKAAVE